MNIKLRIDDNSLEKHRLFSSYISNIIRNKILVDYELDSIQDKYSLQVISSIKSDQVESYKNTTLRTIFMIEFCVREINTEEVIMEYSYPLGFVNYQDCTIIFFEIKENYIYEVFENIVKRENKRRLISVNHDKEINTIFLPLFLKLNTTVIEKIKTTLNETFNGETFNFFSDTYDKIDLKKLLDVRIILIPSLLVVYLSHSRDTFASKLFTDKIEKRNLLRDLYFNILDEYIMIGNVITKDYKLKHSEENNIPYIIYTGGKK